MGKKNFYDETPAQIQSILPLSALDKKQVEIKNKPSPFFPNLRIIFKSVFYPLFMLFRYRRYNSDLTVMSRETKLNLADNIRLNRINTSLFVVLPLLTGLSIGAISIHRHWNDYTAYRTGISRPIGGGSLIGKMKQVRNKIKFIFDRFPVEKDDVYPMFVFYLIAYGGGLFLSLHPAFKQEREITHAFKALGFTDVFGDGWEVVVAPSRLIKVKAIGVDCSSLSADVRIWSIIKFRKSEVKESKKDRNTFYLRNGCDLDELGDPLIFEFPKENKTS